MFHTHRISALSVACNLMPWSLRASRPQSIWHLHKARSRVATHIRVEQIPGLMQSACHEALALATARKAKAAPFTRTNANLYTEQLLFVFLSWRHWHSNFIYRSFPRFWRDFRPNLSTKKRLANSIPRTAKVTINATATTSFFAVKESQFIGISQFSQHLNGGARWLRGQIACAMHVAPGAVPTATAMHVAPAVAPRGAPLRLYHVIANEVGRWWGHRRGLQSPESGDQN